MRNYFMKKGCRCLDEMLGPFTKIIYEDYY